MKHMAAASAILFLGSTAYAVGTTDIESQQSVEDASTDFTSEDIHCLALNSYFESRNQSPNGGIAVTHVVLNRVADKRYPNTICDVVKDASLTSSGAIRRNKCQFSFYCDGKSDDPKNKQAWFNSLYIAHLSGFVPDITEGATHYHSTKVFPQWAYSGAITTKIHKHIFYIGIN